MKLFNLLFLRTIGLALGLRYAEGCHRLVDISLTGCHVYIVALKHKKISILSDIKVLIPKDMINIYIDNIFPEYLKSMGH